MFGEKRERNRIVEDINQFKAAVPNMINTYIAENGYASVNDFYHNSYIYINRFCKFRSKALQKVIKENSATQGCLQWANGLYISVCKELLVNDELHFNIFDYAIDKYVFQALCSFDLYLQEYVSKKTFQLDELLKDAFAKYPIFSPANTYTVWFENVKGFVDIEENYVVAPTDVPSSASGLSLKRDKAYNDYKTGLITAEQYAAVCSEYDRATSYNRMPPTLYEAKYNNGTEYGERIDVTKYLLDRLQIKEYKEYMAPVNLENIILTTRGEDSGIAEIVRYSDVPEDIRRLGKY